MNASVYYDCVCECACVTVYMCECVYIHVCMTLYGSAYMSMQLEYAHLSICMSVHVGR